MNDAVILRSEEIGKKRIECCDWPILLELCKYPSGEFAIVQRINMEVAVVDTYETEEEASKDYNILLWENGNR